MTGTCGPKAIKAPQARQRPSRPQRHDGVRRRRPVETRLLLTAQQVMERMGVGRATFYAWLKGGRLGGLGLKVVELPAADGATPIRRYVASSVDQVIAGLASDAGPIPAKRRDGEEGHAE